MVLEKLRDVNYDLKANRIDIELKSEITPQEYIQLLDAVDNLIILQLQVLCPEADSERLRDVVTTQVYTPLVPVGNKMSLQPEYGFQNELSFVTRILRAFSRV